ncbi:hypothetical protein E4U42_002473 [Claviceps africana]|uniref:Uncharacterized protein n=1 Tax=Claviceps africana TaxID=83212 RepID=A0A8K0JCP9_9HYPO|nr:hypothetical protein E4U42_002473 [Claviceps africana]
MAVALPSIGKKDMGLPSFLSNSPLASIAAGNTTPCGSYREISGVPLALMKSSSHLFVGHSRSDCINLHQPAEVSVAVIVVVYKGITVGFWHMLKLLFASKGDDRSGKNLHIQATVLLTAVQTLVDSWNFQVPVKTTMEMGDGLWYSTSGNSSGTETANNANDG